MPSSDAILSGLTTMANEWRGLAIGWHVFFGLLLLASMLARRLPNRHIGYLLVMPLFSVSGLAWAGGNPFNGTVFFALAWLLVLAARRLSNDPIRCTFGPIAVSGAILLAFGWSYPHFLQAEHWTEYLYAAPLGIVPCPTLSALVGWTLVFGRFHSTGWALTLAAAGLFYGAIGVFRLRVDLDYVLLAGAALLAVLAVRQRSRSKTHSDDAARARYDLDSASSRDDVAAQARIVR